MKKTIFALVDCNNFFVSCERVFRPDLNNTPTVVLSNNDGIIVARSNEVKALGIPMAHPLFKVKDLLKTHNTAIFSANFQLYGDMSRRVNELMKQYSPDIEVYSIDEQFVDLSNLARTDYDKLAAEIRANILKCTGLPVSVGIGPSKTLAKASSEYAKKNPEYGGSYSSMSKKNAQKVLSWLPVGDVWGVGFRWAPRLDNMGIKTALSFTELTQEWVRKNMHVTGVRTWKELRGESCIPLKQSVYIDDHEQKSMTTTRLFGRGVSDLFELEIAAANHAAKLGAKLRRRKQIAWKITVYLQTKSKPFRTTYKQLHLPYPTSDTSVLITYAHKALEYAYDKEKSYRRVGLLLTDLQPETAQQLTLTDDTSVKKLEKNVKINKSLDSLNSKFGPRTVAFGAQGTLNKQEWDSKRQLQTPAYTTRWSQIPIVKAA